MNEMFGRSMSRRAMLGGAAMGAGGLIAAPIFGKSRARKAPIGLQLYTLMKLLDDDFDGTLARVAALGIREVETLGSFGRDPAEVRQMLDRHGLVSPSQHIMPPGLYEVFDAGVRKTIDRATFERKFIEAFSFDRVEALIEACVVQARALGQKYIVWQISWESQLQTLVDIDKLVKALNRAGEVCRREGFMLGYHNHGQEFTLVGNDEPYDIIVRHTDSKNVKLELDVAWAVSRRKDPVALLNKYPGRYRMCHLKDITAEGNITEAGTGAVPFDRFFPAALQAGVEHFYIEYDVPSDPFASLTSSKAYLDRLQAGS